MPCTSLICNEVLVDAYERSKCRLIYESSPKKTETILGLLNRGYKIHGIVFMDSRRAGKSIRDNEANQ